MLTVDDAAAAMGPLTEALEQAGLTEVSIEPANPNLEDLFVQIVRRDRRSEEKGKRGKGKRRKGV